MTKEQTSRGRMNLKESLAVGNQKLKKGGGREPPLELALGDWDTDLLD